ncbi:MAG: pilus assembly protein PilM [Candidatus Saganbacteria bacterium]|nr:pilus assembly protein PilM [Candidatus Saganbacteria bacterium]
MTTSRIILGIDLRVTSVKFVELEQVNEKNTIKNWGLTEVPFTLIDKHPQKEEAQAEALSKLLSDHKVRTKDVEVVIGGDDVFFKVFSLTKMPAAEVAEAIKWKIAEESSYPIEEAIIDYYPLPLQEKDAEKIDYLAAAINVKIYNQIDFIVKKAGLKLVAIRVMPDALLAAFSKEMVVDKDQIISVIYMGKRTTNISILKHGNVEFNRELNIGGENITLAMSGVLVSDEGRVELNPEEAEKIKIEYGIPIDAEKYPQIRDLPFGQLQAMARPALERVQSEIMRTFEYYKGQTGEANIDKIFLSGGSSLTKNLAAFLSEGLGVPIVVPQIEKELLIDESITDKEGLEKNLQRLSAAIGAALLLDEKINLVPREVRHHYKAMAQKVFRPQYVIPVFILALALIYLFFWVQGYFLKQESDYVGAKLAEYRPRVETLNILEKTVQDEQKRKLAFLAYRQKETQMLGVMEEISRLIPSNVFIDTLKLTPDQVHLWGVVFGKGDAPENVLSRFVLILSKSNFFKSVKLIEAKKNEEYVQNAFNFDIVAEINVAK